MKTKQSVGISQVAYHLPKTKFELPQLESAGLLKSKSDLLKTFGFRWCHIYDTESESFNRLINCGEKAIKRAGIEPAQVDYLLLYSGYNDFVFCENNGKSNVLNIFRYPVAKAQHLLGLESANSFAISQQGCGGLFSTINVASSLLKSSDKKNVLCLAYGFLPKGYLREVTYNVISDAVGAMLIQKDSPLNEVVYFYQESNPYYWDSPQHEDEIIASYFPVAQRVIQSCLERLGLKLSDISWFVPHNVSLRSWNILAQLLQIPISKVWTENITRIGHTIACDQVINLSDMQKQKVIKKGDLLMLFTFGFGANWSCVVIKH